MNEFLTIMGSTALLNNMILIAFLLIFSVAFAVESRKKESPVNWIDMILDPITKKVSVTKIGQLVGLGGSTWIIVTLSMNKDAYAMFPMLFPMWLAFIGGTWSYKEWIRSKQASNVGGNQNNSDDVEVDGDPQKKTNIKVNINTGDQKDPEPRVDPSDRFPDK